MANYVLTQTGQEVQDILDSMGATYFFSQSVSSWDADATYPDYPYKGTISLAGVDGTMGAEVTFSNDQAISGNYSPICNTTNDAVEIWSKVNTSITIPTIKIYKNGYVNLNGSSNYMPQSGGNFTGAISVNSVPVLTQSNVVYSYPISTGSVSVPSGVATQVGTITVPKGTNVIQTTIQFDNNATGYRRICCTSNSSVGSASAVEASTQNAINGSGTIMTITTIVSVSANTTYYIGAAQNSGGALTVYPRVKILTFKS